MINDNTLSVIRQLVETAEQALAKARALLEDVPIAQPGEAIDVAEKARTTGRMTLEDNTKIIEGIFDGQNMLGPDGKQYSVPANYASKSKLVEGDRLKLTIMSDGSFIYKQIGPVDRQRLIGSLMRDEASNDFVVVTAERTFRVLLASVTYFKGDVGDEVVILIPKGESGQWAAVENIIKKGMSPVEAEAIKLGSLEDLDSVQ
jgi:hypothetical protein